MEWKKKYFQIVSVTIILALWPQILSKTRSKKNRQQTRANRVFAGTFCWLHYSCQRSDILLHMLVEIKLTSKEPEFYWPVARFEIDRFYRTQNSEANMNISTVQNGKHYLSVVDAHLTIAAISYKILTSNQYCTFKKYNGKALFTISCEIKNTYVPYRRFLFLLFCNFQLFFFYRNSKICCTCIHTIPYVTYVLVCCMYYTLASHSADEIVLQFMHWLYYLFYTFWIGKTTGILILLCACLCMCACARIGW